MIWNSEQLRMHSWNWDWFGKPCVAHVRCIVNSWSAAVPSHIIATGWCKQFLLSGQAVEQLQFGLLLGWCRRVPRWLTSFWHISLLKMNNSRLFAMESVWWWKKISKLPQSAINDTSCEIRVWINNWKCSKYCLVDWGGCQSVLLIQNFHWTVGTNDSHASHVKLQCRAMCEWFATEGATFKHRATHAWFVLFTTKFFLFYRMLWQFDWKKLKYAIIFFN